MTDHQAPPPSPGFGPEWGQPQPPPAKNNRTRNIILIIVAVVLALCCCGGGGVAFFVKKAAEALGPAQDATSAFFEDVAAGDTNAAYDRLCDDTRARFSRERFAQALERNGTDASYEVTSVNVVNSNGKSSATATVKVTDSGGASGSNLVRLVKEDGDWKVCGNPLSP